MRRFPLAVGWWLVVMAGACSSSERTFTNDSATGGSPGTGGGTGSTTSSSTGTGGGGATGTGGTNADDAGADAGPVDCTGKPAGTNCSPAGMTGSICLMDQCVTSHCGDGYVDTAIGEDCEMGDGCSACKFACKMD